MAISRPTLPPKAGYVEVEVDGGRRTYKNVKTGTLIENEKITITPSLEERFAALEAAVQMLCMEDIEI